MPFFPGKFYSESVKTYENNFFKIFILFQGGMGKLRILNNGIRVDGQSEFSKILYTSKINALEVSNFYFYFNII